MTLDVDVLIPAAMENVITKKNANQIQTKLIVEGANGPTSAKADSIINDKGIVLVPDILANAGGVTVSYYEWVQNSANEQWDLELVNQKMQKRIYAAVDAVFDYWQGCVVGDNPVNPEHVAMPAESAPDFRTVALIIAIKRVADATLMRGIWP